MIMVASTEKDKNIHDQIHDIIQSLSLDKNISPDQEKQIGHIAEQFLNQHVSPAEFLKVNPFFIEKAYSTAYNLFQAGKYAESLPLFEFLHSLSPLEARYLFSIAACYHYMKDFLLAANFYIKCFGLDSTNPLPLFYASDCFLQANSSLAAYQMIEMTIYYAKLDPKYKELEQKALLESEAIKDQMTKEFSKY